MKPITIDEQLLFSTLRIEVLDDSNNVIIIGTGFIYRKDVSENQIKILLISNKHILCFGSSLRIKFHKNNDQQEPDLVTFIPVVIQNHRERVISHINSDIDIACINISDEMNRFDKEIFSISITEPFLADFTEPELDVNIRVSFIGYPDDRYDEKHNLPIFRSGYIASHPRIDYNGIKQFIIDAQVFPGSSGSPVMSNLTFENYKNGSIEIGPNKIRLLGIISQTMVRNNKLQNIIATGLTYAVQEIIGLGVVFKSTAIKELIDII